MGNYRFSKSLVSAEIEFDSFSDMYLTSFGKQEANLSFLFSLTHRLCSVLQSNWPSSSLCHPLVTEWQRGLTMDTHSAPEVRCEFSRLMGSRKLTGARQTVLFLSLFLKTQVSDVFSSFLPDLCTCQSWENVYISVYWLFDLRLVF